MTPIGRRGALVAAAVLAAAPRAARAQAPVTFPTSDLVIESGEARHRFRIELADTDDRRVLGLMHRDALAADAGMLFDFKEDRVVAMWMRNTRIPLDMLFIARDGRVVNIAKRTVPFSETSVYSDGPVRAVLEINGGASDRLGLKPGDRVVHAMFRNAPR